MQVAAVAVAVIVVSRAAFAGGRPCARDAGHNRLVPGINQRLTAREMRILRLLRDGLPNKEIARRLNVSEVTAKSHLCHIFRKPGVQNRVQAARLSMPDEDF